MDWHPYAEKFPLLEGTEMDALRESVKATGGNEDQPILFRMRKGVKQGLDGRNREKACIEEGLKPTYKLVSVSDDEVVDFIIRRNVIRRHLTTTLRKSIVADLRANGETIQGIADTLNVSVGTVHSDLNPSFSELKIGDEATETPQNGQENNGVDNSHNAHDDKKRAAEDETEQRKRIKKYISDHPEVTSARAIARALECSDHTVRAVQQSLVPPILCAKCSRLGAVAGCNDCKTSRKVAAKKAKESKKAKAKKGKPEEPSVKDAFGNEVPKRLRDLWGDPWIQKTFDFLTVMQEKFLIERIPDGLHKRIKRLSMFDEKDFIDSCGFIQNYLDQMIGHLKEKRPAGVCPACQGKGCASCNMVGMVSRTVYAKLKGER